MNSNKKYLPYIYILPSIIIIVSLCLLPSIYSIYLAMSQAKVGTDVFHFVGFANFRTLLNDSWFWESFRNSIAYSIGTVSLTIIFGFITALLFNTNPKFNGLYLTLIFIPWVLSEVVTGVVWRWLFNSQYGVVDIIFKVFHAQPSQWLNDPIKAMMLMIIIGTWRTLPFAMILLLSGLQSIPRELIECSKIDGCNSLQTFYRIIIPLIAQTLGVVTLLCLIGAMNTTGTFIAVTNGGPMRATETLSLYMYKEAFVNFHLSNSASISVSLLIINIVIAYLYFRVMRNQNLD